MGVLQKMKENPQHEMGEMRGKMHEEAGEEAPAKSSSGAIDPFEKVYDTPEEQEAVDRVVAAGSKILYSDKGSQEIVEGLKTGAPPEAIAREAFALMLSLDQKSKGTIPEDAMIPAAAKLAALIAELGQKSGVIKVDANTVPGAHQHLVALAIENGLIDPQDIEAMMAEMDPNELKAMVAEQEQIATGKQVAGGDPGKQPPPEAQEAPDGSAERIA